MYRTLFYTPIYRYPTVNAEITHFSTKYRGKLTTHPIELIPALLEEEEPRRLKRFKSTELTNGSHKIRTQVREHLM